MCSLRKFCSFVSRFSGPPGKHWFLRRAEAQREVLHLALSFFAGCNGGTSTVWSGDCHLQAHKGSMLTKNRAASVPRGLNPSSTGAGPKQRLAASWLQLRRLDWAPLAWAPKETQLHSWQEIATVLPGGWEKPLPWVKTRSLNKSWQISGLVWHISLRNLNIFC